MQHRVAQTLRFLARLVNQQTARTNAAEGVASLRRRRQDQEQVDEYLQGRLLTFPIAETKGEHGVSLALAYPPAVAGGRVVVTP